MKINNLNIIYIIEDMIDSNHEWILKSAEDISIECKYYEDTINKFINIYEKGIEGKTY